MTLLLLLQLPMAPKEAPCSQTHRLRLFSQERIVFESTQHISGIPMGDLFKVEARWDVTPVAGAGSGSGCQVCCLRQTSLLECVQQPALTMQHISGIPVGDLFMVEARWDVTPVAGAGSGSAVSVLVCKMTISAEHLHP